MLIYNNDTIFIKVSHDTPYSKKTAIAEDFKKLYPNNVIMVVDADIIKNIEVMHNEKSVNYYDGLSSLSTITAAATSTSAPLSTYGDNNKDLNEEEPVILDKIFIY